MKIISQVKRQLKVTTYNLWVSMREQGIDISKEGFYKLERSQSEHIRADILLALMKLAGLSWAEVGKLIEKEHNKK